MALFRLPPYPLYLNRASWANSVWFRTYPFHIIPHQIAPRRSTLALTLINSQPTIVPFTLLRLTRVEANVDSLGEGLLGFLEGRLRRTRYKGDLRGFLKRRRCWGLPQLLLATVGCYEEFKVEGLRGSIHSRVVRRLREIQGEQSRFKLKLQVQEVSSYISGDSAHGPSDVHSRKAKADIKSKWSVR